MDSSLEKEILKYLREGAAEQRDRLERERLRDDAIARLTNHVQLLEAAIEHAKELYDERFSGLSARMSKVEQELLDTGEHDISHLEQQLAEKRAELAKLEQRKHDSGIWWKHSAVQWIVGGIGAAVLLVGGTLLGILVRGMLAH